AFPARARPTQFSFTTPSASSGRKPLHIPEQRCSGTPAPLSATQLFISTAPKRVVRRPDHLGAPPMNAGWARLIARIRRRLNGANFPLTLAPRDIALLRALPTKMGRPILPVVALRCTTTTVSGWTANRLNLLPLSLITT